MEDWQSVDIPVVRNASLHMRRPRPFRRRRADLRLVADIGKASTTGISDRMGSACENLIKPPGAARSPNCRRNTFRLRNAHKSRFADAGRLEVAAQPAAKRVFSRSPQTAAIRSAASR